MNASPDISRHPCFNEEAKGVCGRVHLPVAPKCNIKCNYCDRRYDCVNESRPGVSSSVLSPQQALLYMHGVLAREPSITVVGIAGPGDPLANPKETFETMTAIRAEYPEMLFCLSTNGLALPANVDKIAELGVSHVTVTVNAIDPEVGQKVYAWARDGKVIYRGLEAAKVLLERQLEGIRMLKERNIIVKVNTIFIPGVNDEHIPAVAEKMSSMGVDVLNVMAMVPNAGTPFGELEEPSHAAVDKMREIAGEYLPQMRHCQRCRADAVGLLEDDKSGEFAELLADSAETIILDTVAKPYVAVATREGLLVNQHLGEAATFQIWEQSGDKFRMVEEREAPPKGAGANRWKQLAETLKDCRAVLVSGYGESPNAVMTDAGVPPVEIGGFIEMALKSVYEGKNMNSLRRRKSGGCSKGISCGGDGGGCG